MLLLSSLLSFVLYDFQMKMLTDYYRETTAENFGKRGLSVIGYSVVINKTA